MAVEAWQRGRRRRRTYCMSSIFSRVERGHAIDAGEGSTTLVSMGVEFLLRLDITTTLLTASQTLQRFMQGAKAYLALEGYHVGRL